MQLYLTRLNSPVPVPIRSLAGFCRISLEPGESRVARFKITPRQLSVIDGAGKRVELPGRFRLEVGGKQAGFHGEADATTTEVLSTEFEVAGPAVPVE